jgi:type II secretory pathway predicted ATPase ExeA
MKEAGGIRITEEQELLVLKRRLATYPQAIQTVVQAAHALRRSVRK